MQLQQGSYLEPEIWMDPNPPQRPHSLGLSFRPHPTVVVVSPHALVQKHGYATPAHIWQLRRHPPWLLRPLLASAPVLPSGAPISLRRACLSLPWSTPSLWRAHPSSPLAAPLPPAHPLPSSEHDRPPATVQAHSSARLHKSVIVLSPPPHRRGPPSPSAALERPRLHR